MKKKLFATIIGLLSMATSIILIYQLNHEKKDMNADAYQFAMSFAIVVLIAGVFILIITHPKKQRAIVKQDSRIPTKETADENDYH
jgi:Kef-type K+ transport system membrane component KefB